MWNTSLEKIDIELTSFCNIRCTSCVREVSNYSEAFNNKKEYILDIDLIRKRFRKEWFPQLKVINFCGTIDEPTLHPNFFEVIEHFKDWSARILISTNGYTRNESWWHNLAHLLKDTDHRVVWGLDGIDEVSEIYRRGSRFSRVQKHFRAFNSSGGKSTWQFIVMEHNQHQLELVKGEARKEGFKTVKIIYSSRVVLGGNVQYIKINSGKTAEIECKFLKPMAVFVNCIGDVIPCCHWNPDHLEFLSDNYILNKKPNRRRYLELWQECGGYHATNLKYNTIEEVINGKFFKEVSNSWKDYPSLERCEHMCRNGNFSKSELLELE